MQVLISDANVLIDMDAGGLLELMFHLPFEFQVADMLFTDELAEHHPELLSLGLKLAELDGPHITLAFDLINRYADPSRYDCFSLALAKQKSCPLLTGDKALRTAAAKEGVLVKGTIWLVNQLVINGILTKAEALEAYAAMRGAGSRLPWDVANSMLEEL
ncbi:PIN domain-containing protein [Thalassolituus marinus]|uniref:PIN domain-containing protein n=1 Tax=Thalassolituus marinus TaxID=671053 RepID=A0ABS7ZMT2_9GAMM|nr:PIN domain-containing protein [Thalassolituus marinus]MCA6062513.1 PIN domain-containing protein [Thalassolituus marinus]